MRNDEREVAERLAIEPASGKRDEFGAFLREVSGAVGEALTRRAPEQQLAQAIMRWEGDGFRTARLEAGLAHGLTVDEVDRLIASFENDVARLQALTDLIRTLDAAAPELARDDVLLDPDRVDTAEKLVARLRDRLQNAGLVHPHPNGAAARELDDDAAVRSVAISEVGVIDRWFLSPEKVVWRWPYVEDAIVMADEEDVMSTCTSTRTCTRT